jgi:hypothetical protein
MQQVEMYQSSANLIGKKYFEEKMLVAEIGCDE